MPLDHEQIRTWAARLNTSLNEPKQDINPEPLRRLYRAGRYTEMVGLIRAQLKLGDIKVRVGLVNSGGPTGTSSWIDCPTPMPLYGSPAFARTSVTIYLRKELLTRGAFDHTVAAVAYELASVLLAAIGYLDCDDDKLAELAAMHLGFKAFFLRISRKPEPRGAERPKSRRTIEECLEDVLHDLAAKIGPETPSASCYLSVDEVRYAARLMAV